MRTFKQIKGLPVIEYQSAKQIGRVTDLIFSQNGIIAGICVNSGLLQKSRQYPKSSIVSIGQDCVMVDCAKSRDKFTQQNLGFLSNHLYHKTVFSSNGNILGLLEDVYFCEQVGTILAYELTEGFFADLTEGKKQISPQTPQIKVSKEALVVDFMQE
ncbi:PRC-barrel domain-containing protein [Metabacillus arenae]|uniref:PRC-barrel domain-containing protein n=1 Tax=Metabacillus arenae TaxID=2771434 RepID=A0A926ND21_9BACI|nr:PRC-barrel domain-containing protein [Metabacillus arenae]MBD1381254.1 PRC-barrel domain-containing protein [Metabacillus arenae]